MKLELIVPAAGKFFQRREKTSLPPLGLAMIAAVTPSWVEVSLTDENVTAIDFQKETDLVGITATTVTAPHVYEIADAFRVRGVKVVLGGIHPTVLPEEASQHADAVVIGEAEGIWPSLIEDFKENRLQRVYRNNQRPNLLGLPLPRRELFKKGAYLLPNSISTTRGCPYSCSFCSISSIFGHTYRCRPVAEILKEISTFKDRKLITFVDDNIVGNPKFAKELFRGLVPYKIRWLGQASLTIARDNELLELAAVSGCIGLLIGFESLSAANMAAVAKRVNVDEYEQGIRKIHSHRIAILGSFIFGFDGDDEAVFEDTVRFSQKMRLESAHFNILTPYPGTAIYQSFNKAGRILTKDWSKYGYESVFEPKRMSREMLQRGTDWAWRQFYSLPSILRRVGVTRHNLAMLWLMNLRYLAEEERLRGNRVVSNGLKSLVNRFLSGQDRS